MRKSPLKLRQTKTQTDTHTHTLTHTPIHTLLHASTMRPESNERTGISRAKRKTFLLASNIKCLMGVAGQLPEQHSQSAQIL